MLFYRQARLSRAAQSTRTAKSMAPADSRRWHTASSRMASTAGTPRRQISASCKYANLAFSYTPAEGNEEPKEPLCQRHSAYTCFVMLSTDFPRPS